MTTKVLFKMSENVTLECHVRHDFTLPEPNHYSSYDKYFHKLFDLLNITIIFVIK